MNRRQLPEEVQDRVKRWYDYVWTRYKGVHDLDVLQSLPKKLHSDLVSICEMCVWCVNYVM